MVLKPTEEKVVRFLAPRKRGASISEISRGVDLARTSIYDAAESLIGKKLLTKDGFDYDLADRKLRKHKDSRSEAKGQISVLLKEMLELERGDIIYSIESDEEIEYLLREEKGLLKWQGAVAEKGIVLKGVGSPRALSLFRSIMDEKLSREIKKRSGSARFTAEGIPGPCILVSFKNSIVFFSRKRNFFYRIDDTYVARFTQNVMESLYLQLQYRPLIKD